MIKFIIFVRIENVLPFDLRPAVPCGYLMGGDVRGTTAAARR
jgi:hypothetical protein